MNFSNRDLQVMNILLTIIVVVIALFTFILTKEQTFYTEKATRSDRIQQDLQTNYSINFCKNNPEEKNSNLFSTDGNAIEFTCAEVNNISSSNNLKQIFLLSLIIFFVFWVGLSFGNNKRTFLINQAKKKQENKEKILEYLKNNEKITNNDVEKLLGVSDATATRYLSELEKEQKIKQIGTVGHAVYYRLI